MEQVTQQPAMLGEGPCWHEQQKVLYWIDILGKQLHCYDPVSEQDRSWQLDQMIGTVAPRQSGGLLVALEQGLASFDPETGQLEHRGVIDDNPETRFNDGKCDPAGRFWCGTMDLQEARPLGALYRFDPDGQTTQMVAGVTISNGMGWNPDRTVMYYIDSPTKQVWGYDYDLQRGTISHRRTVIQLGDEDGWPDGMTVDQEGMIWLAEWGAGRVGRWDPARGEVLQYFKIPAPHTSACCFGGEGLRDLYVTTARKGLSEEQLAQYPASGCLFRIRTEVAGNPTFAFAE